MMRLIDNDVIPNVMDDVVKEPLVHQRVGMFGTRLHSWLWVCLLCGITLILCLSARANVADATTEHQPSSTTSSHFASSHSTAVTPANAQQLLTPKDARQMIEDVAQSERYGKKSTIKRWERKNKKTDESETDDSDSWLEDFLDWLIGNRKASENVGVNLAQTAEVLMWVFFAVLAVYILTQLGKWAGWLGTAAATKHRATYERPTELFGLALDAESLPKDVVKQVKSLLASGQMRDAVALLYRASLIRLMHDHGIEIPTSATERECQDIVMRSQPEAREQVFTELTRLWLQVAYDKTNPDVSAVYALCERWPEQFDSARMSSADVSLDADGTLSQGGQ